MIKESTENEVWNGGRWRPVIDSKMKAAAVSTTSEEPTTTSNMLARLFRVVLPQDSPWPWSLLLFTISSCIYLEYFTERS